MGKIVEIPKCNEDHSNFPCWIPTIDTSGNQCRPHIRCKCGQYTGIGLHHIHTDGTVTASYYHKYPDASQGGCGWHVFIKFMNYDEGEWKPNDDKSRPKNG